MSVQEREIRLRLTAKGREELIETLRGMGREGERAARQIERAGRQAGAGLRTVDNTAKELKNSLMGTASRIPIIGRSVAALGPAGLVAAAGVAALAVAFQRALAVAREAVREFDAIAKRADDLGFSTDYYQGVTELARQESVALEQVNTALSSFARNSSRAATGRGEMVEMLRATHPELLREIAALRTADERLERYTQALRESESQTERNILATAAFGESGFAVARMLAQQENGIEGFIREARSMGLVVDEFILRRAEEMETRMSVASRVIDLNLKQAFIDLAPILVETAEFLADVAAEIHEITDAFVDLEDRASSTIRRDLAEEQRDLQDVVERRNNFLERRGALGSVFGPYSQNRQPGHFQRADGREDFSARLQLWDREIARREARINAFTDVLAGREDSGSEGGEDEEDLARLAELYRHVSSARDNAMSSAERLAESLDMLREARAAGIIQSDEELARLEAAERQRHADTQGARARAQAEREAASIRAELGDFTGLLAIKEAELQVHVNAGRLDREQATEILRIYREELESSTDAARRAAAITESVRTPAETYAAALEELNALLDDNKINEEVHARAVEAARRVYEDTDPVLRTAAEVREALLSVSERFTEEQRRVNAAVRAGALDAGDAAEYLDQYREMLERSADSTERLRFESELLDRILDKQVETWQDLANVALDVLRDIIREQIRLADVSQGFGAFLSQILRGTVGAFNFGSSASSEVSFNAGVATGTAGAPFTPAGAPQTAGAPIALAGLEDAIVSAFERTFAGRDRGERVELILKDGNGQRVQTSERRSPDGTRQVTAFLKEQMDGLIRGGKLDEAFGDSFGLQRRARRTG